MPQTRQNGGVVPVGSDPYALTQDWAKFADSLNVNIPINSLTERNNLTPVEGMTVVRRDLKGIIEVYIDGAWAGSGSTAISTFGGTPVGTGWAPLGSGHTPRVYRSGGIIFLVGGVTLGTNSTVSNILTIPTQFRPSTTASMFVGSGVSSNGQAFQLILTNGVLSIPTGYLGGSLAIGTAIPVKAEWPLY